MIGSQGPGASAETIERTLAEVLELREFHPEESTAETLLGKFFTWLGELFSSLMESGGAGGADVIEVVVAILGAALVVWILWRVLMLRRSRGPALAQIQAEEVRARRVEELRSSAREAEQAGEWTRALRLHFFALVVALGERGEIDYRDAWTSRELLERGEPSKSVRVALAPLLSELDEHSFGRRPTDFDEVRRFSELCDRLLGRSVA